MASLALPPFHLLLSEETIRFMGGHKARSYPTPRHHSWFQILDTNTKVVGLFNILGHKGGSHQTTKLTHTQAILNAAASPLTTFSFTGLSNHHICKMEAVGSHLSNGHFLLLDKTTEGQAYHICPNNYKKSYHAFLGFVGFSFFFFISYPQNKQCSGISMSHPNTSAVLFPHNPFPNLNWKIL